MHVRRKRALRIAAIAIAASFALPAFFAVMWLFFPYPSYRLYMAWLSTGVRDGYRPLPEPLVTELQPFYRHDLAGAAYAHTSRLPNGLAVADCKTVYFGNAELVGALRQGAVLTDRQLRWLAHELTHGEQCERWGGRKIFAQTWFSQADASAWDVVRAGKGFDALYEYVQTAYIRGLHDAMPMEIEADERAQAVLGAFR